MSILHPRGDALAWLTILSCASCMLLFGYDQGVMSGLISATEFKEAIFGTQNPSSTISGLVVAIYEIGAFVGAISVMVYGNRIGRKWTTVIAQVITIAGAIMQATSFGLKQMIAARVISGVGVGQITATVPVWSVEIARTSYRGKAGNALTLCAVTGVVTSYWVDYGASSYKSSFSFRFPLGLQVLFCILQLCTVPFLPESPRWLLSQGKEAKAMEIIKAICDGDDLGEPSSEALEMFNTIKLAVETEDNDKSAIKDIFTPGPLQYWRRMLLTFGLQAMQQLSGINVIAYYSVVVFKQSVHMSNHLALLIGGFVALAFWCGTVIAIPLIDRVGRRPLMIWGYTGTCIGMGITAIGTSMPSHAAGIAATFGIFFFNFNFGIGLQVPPWIYGVEITPLKLRQFAGGVQAASGWIWNYVVVQITQPGIQNIGYKFFIIWTVLNFCFVWVVFFFYPETAGKSLEELDFIFMKPEERPLGGHGPQELKVAEEEEPNPNENTKHVESA